MAEVKRVGDIELPQDLGYERRAYRVRTVAAVAFGVVIVAGLLGLLGRSGPLSEATASAGALRVGYERFLRLDTPTELELSLAAGSGPTEIALGQDFLEGFEVRAFSVEPERATVRADRVVYAFDLEAPAQLTIVLEPEEIGRQTAVLHGPAGARVSFDQWVWP